VKPETAQYLMALCRRLVYERMAWQAVLECNNGTFYWYAALLAHRVAACNTVK
jgi:hypothetical protein